MAYLLGGFQPVVRNDDDPNSESKHFGLTPADDRGRSVIYIEIHNEADVAQPGEEQDTVIHELSHVFGTSDAPGEPTDGVGNLTPLSLHLMRTVERPESLP